MTEQAFQTQGRGGNRVAIIVLGTVGVLLIAGIIFQVFRAKPGAAESVNRTNAPNQIQPVAAKQSIDAIVGDQEITSQQIAMECYNRYREEVLEAMINRLIIQQACEKNNVRILKSEVEQEIRSIAQRFKLDVDQWYKMLQAERGIAPDQYQKDVIWPMLALRKLAGVNTQVNQTEYRQAYERAYGPKVKARIIMLDNRNFANKVWEHLRQHPEDFEKYAREHSIDPSTKPLGGLVPPIQKYSGSEEIWKAAFSLQKDEISSILVLFGNKYVILKCEGRTEPVAVDPKEVQADLVEQLKEQKQQTAVAEVFDKLKKRTRVVNKLNPSKSNLHPEKDTVQQVSGQF